MDLYGCLVARYLRKDDRKQRGALRYGAEARPKFRYCRAFQRTPAQGVVGPEVELEWNSNVA